MQQSKPTIEQPGVTSPPSEPSRDQKRKPYMKPAIVYLAPLEAMAGVCDPLGGGKDGGICTTANS